MPATREWSGARSTRGRGCSGGWRCVRVSGGQLAPGSKEARAERRKASVRAKAEHPFLYVKRHFGYAKVRYRGLEKNRQRLALLLGFANLLRAAPQLA